MREFVLLAKTFDPSKHRIAGWYASEKYDGQRFLWDGGISRGQLKASIPWANRKDTRKLTQTCTGLWSRYGNIIHAPSWFLDKLPKNQFLDGELFTERGDFQSLRSIVSRHEPDSELWQRIRCLVFDLPSPEAVFEEGTISNPNWGKHKIDPKLCLPWAKSCNQTVLPFARVQTLVRDIPNVEPVGQLQLPKTEDLALEVLWDFHDVIIRRGGEGLILRRPISFWEPHRSDVLLKVKLELDAEATIVGFNPGEGKNAATFGSLQCTWNGKTFNVAVGAESDRVNCKLGDVISFKYMALTNDGIPREPRYWRKY